MFLSNLAKSHRQNGGGPYVDLTVPGCGDVVPGLVVGIQTHGELANWHPHLHALATGVAFAPDGAFIPMPDTTAEPYLQL